MNQQNADNNAANPGPENGDQNGGQAVAVPQNGGQAVAGPAPQPEVLDPNLEARIPLQEPARKPRSSNIITQEVEAPPATITLRFGAGAHPIVFPCLALMSKSRVIDEAVMDHLEQWDYDAAVPLVLSFPGLDFRAGQLMLDHVLDEPLNILNTEALPLLQAARRFEMAHLERIAGNMFQRRLTAQEGLIRIDEAMKTNSTYAFEYALGDVAHNAEIALRSPSVFQVSRLTLETVLECDHLRLNSEDTIYEVLWSLAQHYTGQQNPSKDLVVRRLGNLLTLLRVKYVSPEVLAHGLYQTMLKGRECFKAFLAAQGANHQQLRFNNEPRIPRPIDGWEGAVVVVQWADAQARAALEPPPMPQQDVSFLIRYDMVPHLTGLIKTLIPGCPKPRELRFQMTEDASVASALIGTHDEVSNWHFENWLVTGEEVIDDLGRIYFGRKVLALRIKTVQVNGAPLRHYFLDIGLTDLAKQLENSQPIGLMATDGFETFENYLLSSRMTGVMTVTMIL